jgi:hypothetical protein
VGLVVIAVGLGLISGSQSEDFSSLLRFEALGAIALALVAGGLARRLLVSLLVCVPGSVAYTTVFWLAAASVIEDEDWTDADTGYAIGLTWFLLVFLMELAALVGWYFWRRKGLGNWQSDVAIIEEARAGARHRAREPSDPEA